MVTIEQAQKIILERVPPLPTQRVPLLDAAGRVLAQDLVTPYDFPMVDTSAMDGYAFCFDSLNGEALPVSGFLPAGAEPTPVRPGTAVRIMTGAPVPQGCDTVVPIEETAPDGEGIVLTGKVRKGSHVRKRGEDLRRGECVVAAGRVIRGPEVGMAASLGMIDLPSYRRAKVALLATGDELLEMGAPPMPGRIVNSNSISLAAQVITLGAAPQFLGIARDDLVATMVKLRAGLESDAVVVTGGVSVGDRDYVKEAIESLGGELLFWKVNMKPGKPVAFAMVGNTPVFALPGNPVAALVGFELFVRPALLKMMGHRALFRASVRARVTAAVANRGDRPHLLRGSVVAQADGAAVTVAAKQSSANLGSMTGSNALVLLPPNAALEAGAMVDAMLLD
ncbi:molybdopterin molybdotransferase MoeA [Geomesophilobacter sediminis]|uniref:Molybdopterin molybdenumtransferase n=1 Tax=Geomesophilobacter sediminis TaxID=2798584 RepID=A0A8J7J1M5_9BACT|nr:gephyrin-like molybdotransferase Glp [Geomesophilobacter sediminis]MBJ6724693.1 molybdopterin molybdotransferase MoeA [Geomesophilobacter sediminis]